MCAGKVLTPDADIVIEQWIHVNFLQNSSGIKSHAEQHAPLFYHTLLLSSIRNYQEMKLGVIAK